VSVNDRWHLVHPPAGARKCSHRKYPSAEHEQGLRWQVRGFDADERPVKRNFEYEDQAKDFDAELKAAVKAGRYVDDRAGKVTLKSRCELWWRSREYDPLTAERVEATFRNHVYEDPDHPGRTPRGSVAIGELSIGLLARQPSRIASWFTALPLSVNSRLLLFDLVSAVFEAAIADHIIVENPFKTKAVSKPRHEDTDVVAWEAEQLAGVASMLPARWLPMPLLAGACGHRQGEAFAVAKTDIDWIRRTCRIEVQVKTVGNRLVFAPIKNDNARTVPIGRPVADLLSAHLRDDEHRPRMVTLPWSQKGSRLDGKPVTRELLFTREDGRALSRSAFNPYWRKSVRAAGIEYVPQVTGFHVCRHSCAAAWLSDGLNIARVADYLGDSVAVVSKTYSHFLPRDEDRARAIMDEHWAVLAGRSNALTIPFEGRG
jgi:integrase